MAPQISPLAAQDRSTFIAAPASRGASTWQLLVVLTLLAACMRVAGIGAEPFWKNEFFSIYWSAQPATFLAGTGMFTETNPPLYFLALKLWMSLFGTDAAAVRSLSALASTLSVPMIFAVGRALGSRDVGLVAALLMAFAPVQLYFAHEARIYAFLPLLVLLAMQGLIWFLTTPTKVQATKVQARKVQAGNVQAGLALTIASGTALLYAHGTGVFVMAALGLATLLYLIDIKAPRQQLVAFLAGSAGIILLALPVLAAIVVLSRSPNIEWMPKFGLDTILVSTRFLLVGPLLRFDIAAPWRGVLFGVECALALGGLACVMLLARRGMAASPIKRLAVALVAVFPLLFIALLCGVSVFRPVLIPRVTIWLYVPFALAAGFALMGARGWPRLVTLGLVCGAIGFGQWDTVLAPSLHKPDVPGYVRDFRPQDAAANTVFVGPHTGPLGVRHYAGAPVADIRVWWPKAERPVTTADIVERRNSGAMVVGTEAIAAALQSGTHGQLLLDDDDTPLLPALLEAVPALVKMPRHEYASLLVLAW